MVKIKPNFGIGILITSVFSGISEGWKNRNIKAAPKRTNEAREKAKIGPKLKINVLAIPRKEPTIPPAKVRRLAANGNSFGILLYLPNKEIAGERNTVIANAQATKANGNSSDYFRWGNKGNNTRDGNK